MNLPTLLRTLNPVWWHPFWFAIIYGALVIGFAAFYSEAIADDFFHSTVQYEPQLRDVGADVVDQVQADLRDNFRTVYKTDSIESNGWTLDADDINVDYIKPSPDSMTVGMSFRLERSSPAVESQDFYFDSTFKFGPRASEVIIFPKDGEPLHLKTTTFSPARLTFVFSQTEIPYTVLFPVEETYGNYAQFVLTESGNNSLTNFWQASQGHPAKVPGTFPRMFYLSAVTITTVGYGDVVPLTTEARLAVAAEAILGVLTAGLFVTALFTRRPKAATSRGH